MSATSCLEFTEPRADVARAMIKATQFRLENSIVSQTKKFI
jgi:hypothetical protein